MIEIAKSVLKHACYCTGKLNVNLLKLVFYFSFELFNLFSFFVEDRDLVSHQQVKGQYFVHVKLTWFNHFNVLTNLSMIMVCPV